MYICLVISSNLKVCPELKANARTSVLVNIDGRWSINDISVMGSQCVMNKISIDFNVVTVLILHWKGCKMCNIYGGSYCASFQVQVAWATTLAATLCICIPLMCRAKMWHRGVWLRKMICTDRYTKSICWVALLVSQINYLNQLEVIEALLWTDIFVELQKWYLS